MGAELQQPQRSLKQLELLGRKRQLSLVSVSYPLVLLHTHLMMSPMHQHSHLPLDLCGMLSQCQVLVVVMFPS